MGRIAGIAASLKEMKAQSVGSNNRISGEDTNNPTVIPNSLLRQFQYSFLIRHPSRAIPSYYRCTIPPLSEVTGFDYFDPREAGFRETRILLEHLLNAKILRREDVILIDADDLLDNPHGIISEYCKRVGIEYNPSMLEWEATQCGAFEKWKGFHEDAMKSGGLKARTVVSLSFHICRFARLELTNPSTEKTTEVRRREHRGVESSFRRRRGKIDTTDCAG